MAIFRNKHDNNYSCIDNGLMRDKRLSLKARGLLTYMLSCKDDWEFNISNIASMCDDGLKSVSAGLIELEKKGYLRRRYTAREVGQGSDMVYDVFETNQHIDFYAERKKLANESTKKDFL